MLMASTSADALSVEPAATFTAAMGRRSYSVPLVVAVSGHRDLVAAEVPLIRERVRGFLCELRDTYPDRPVAVMSPLAEGADRLVAEEAISLGLPLTVPLPMPRHLYVRDFATAESRAQFARLCAAAVDVFELPLTPGNTEASIEDHGKNRARQYAQLGVFLCAHCHVLLALWDGRPSDQIGGTGQVVQFHHNDVMPGYTPRATSSRLTLTDDESDLVYHIVCSRDRPGGSPADGLTPLEASWFTTDEMQPRSREMPLRHRQVFQRTNEFNREARTHAEAIDRERYALITEQQAGGLPPGLLDINQVFCAADWLAIRYQRRFMQALRATHVCVFLIGMSYLSYTDYNSTRSLILVIVGLMAAAVGLGYLANRGSWHRKYLDYRTLAEGLRVQFYWAAAGVTSGNVTKFAHDNFLQMQDPDLGWIRNVMRVAGTECDVLPNRAPEGVRFAIREWIGDAETGQLGYYGRKSAERVVRQKGTERIGRLGLLATGMALTALWFIGSGIPEYVRNPIVYIMGCIVLLVGVRQSYAQTTAESELIKQYEFMHRIFGNARRRLDEAENDVERRHILKILGDASLEEHAQWILMYRERSLDNSEGTRIG
jgi:hypothetical protein